MAAMGLTPASLATACRALRALQRASAALFNSSPHWAPCSAAASQSRLLATAPAGASEPGGPLATPRGAPDARVQGRPQDRGRGHGRYGGPTRDPEWFRDRDRGSRQHRAAPGAGRSPAGDGARGAGGDWHPPPSSQQQPQQQAPQKQTEQQARVQPGQAQQQLTEQQQAGQQQQQQQQQHPAAQQQAAERQAAKQQQQQQQAPQKQTEQQAGVQPVQAQQQQTEQQQAEQQQQQQQQHPASQQQAAERQAAKQQQQQQQAAERQAAKLQQQQAAAQQQASELCRAAAALDKAIWPRSGPVVVEQCGDFTLLQRPLPPLQRPRDGEEQRCLEVALGVVRRLRHHGYTCLLAGGWVRDQFLPGRRAADIDMVTNATHVELFEVFGTSACRLKGGNTCDVRAEGLSFELTTYRGGLKTDSREAEWRDAASRDFMLNALFFDPQLPPLMQPPTAATAAAAPTAPGEPAAGAPGSTQLPPTAGATPASAPAPAQASIPAAQGLTGPPLAPSPSPPLPPPLAPPSLAPPPHLQPAGMVRDYVGGLMQLKRRELRLYRRHAERLGNALSSVEEDPIRVLRAARLMVGLQLRMDSYTEACVRRAAALCELRRAGSSSRPRITAARVYRELSKMAELDLAEGAEGGAAEGKGKGPGSPRFAAALELCRQWGVLEALLPGMDHALAKTVISSVLPRLPPRLPLELKLSALMAAPALGEGVGLLPHSQPEGYQPLHALLEECRDAQTRWPHLLCALTDLMLTDNQAERRGAAWAELLAAEGIDMVEAAMAAFIAPSHHAAFEAMLAAIRQRLQAELQVARARRRRQGQLEGAAGAAGGRRQ